jgi:hypothetical protein
MAGLDVGDNPIIQIALMGVLLKVLEDFDKWVFILWLRWAMHFFHFIFFNCV